MLVIKGVYYHQTPLEKILLIEEHDSPN